MTQPIPTRDQTDEKIERLRHLTNRRITTRGPDGKKVETPALDILAARIHRHLDLERNHPSRPDGYRTVASGGGNSYGTGPTITVIHREPDTLTIDVIPVTTVEAAVFARLRWKDEHRTQTQTAYTHLTEAIHHLAALTHTLDKLDLQPTPDDLNTANDDQWCTNHLRYQRLEPRNTRRRTKACTWCQDFKQTVGSWPPEALVVMHDRGERIYDRDILAHFPHYQAKP